MIRRPGAANDGDAAIGEVSVLPPHNVEAEAAVLGAILVSPQVVAAISGRAELRVDEFFRSAHADIYAAMLVLHRAGVAIDTITLTDALDRRGRLSAVGGPVAIDALHASVPDVGSFWRYAEVIKRAARERRVRELARKLTASPDDREALAALQALTPPVSAARSFVSISDFVALERPSVERYISSTDGRTVLLAAGYLMLVVGPSGVGKSLEGTFTLPALLAGQSAGDWLGLRVSGGHKVLLISLEGSDEDTSHRARTLVPPPARAAMYIYDTWRAPLDHDSRVAAIAAEVRRRAIDVVVIDTASAFFEGSYDTAKGVPEVASKDLDLIRRLSGRPVAFICVHHTRKAASTPSVDPLEESSGSIHKRADTVVAIRLDGKHRRRRKIAFAKVRRGPGLPDIIAELPPDPGAPPRLTPLAPEQRPAGADRDLRSEILAYAKSHPEGASRNMISGAVTGRKESVLDFIKRLVDEGELVEGDRRKLVVPERQEPAGTTLNPQEDGSMAASAAPPVGGRRQGNQSGAGNDAVPGPENDGQHGAL